MNRNRSNESNKDRLIRQPSRRDSARRSNPAPRYYFAYGSNLNMNQISHRCRDVRPIQPYTLADFQLVFRRVADIVPCSGASVQGAIYAISPADEAALDAYEGYNTLDPERGLYRKESFPFLLGGVEQTCMYYAMNRGEEEPPSQTYYSIIADGYSDWRLPLLPLEQALARAQNRPQPEDAWSMRSGGVGGLLSQAWRQRSIRQENARRNPPPQREDETDERRYNGD